MTSTEMKADACSAVVPAERSVKNMTYAVSSPTSVSVASEPIECARSARASSVARRTEMRFSTTATGTTRPTKPSQTTAGSSPKTFRNETKTAAGSTTTNPIAAACAISRGRSGLPAT